MKVGWGQAEKGCRELCGKLGGRKYSAVVCIATGGLVPGKLISGMLGLPLGVVVSKRYHKARKNPGKWFLDARVRWFCRPIKPKSVLLVDDIIDEGKTAARVIAALKRDKNLGGVKRVDVCVLFRRTKEEPQVFGAGKVFSFRRATGWVVFPWEAKSRE